jgi:hypothetical protein
LSVLFVSLIQIFIIGFIAILIAILSPDFNSIIFDRFLNNHNYKLWKTLIALLILGFNFHRYFAILNFDKIKTKLSFEDSKTKSRNGWILAWSIILIFITVIGLAILRQNIYK